MNNDLIDRNTLLDNLRLLAKYQPEYKASTILGVCLTIKARPAVDAVEVVRCKNCKHYENGVCGHITCIMDGYYRNTFEVKTPDDFCSIGERLDVEVSE